MTFRTLLGRLRRLEQLAKGVNLTERANELGRLVEELAHEPEDKNVPASLLAHLRRQFTRSCE